LIFCETGIRPAYTDTFFSNSNSRLRHLIYRNYQLDNDVKNCDPKRDPKCIPKLSQDEGMCKYGQSGEARSEACKRMKEAGKEVPKPAQGKSLGGAYAM